jgi:DNA-binding MarR family transcriptional regulator
MKMPNTDEMADRFLELLQRVFRERPKLMFPDERVASLKRQLHSLRANSARSAEDRVFLFRILGLLHNREAPPTMGDLSAELGIPLSSATRMADSLVRVKFVQRCDDEHDRRIVRLCLTDKGRAFIELGLGVLRQRVVQALGKFTGEEQAQLLALATKLIDSLQAERKDETL